MVGGAECSKVGGVVGSAVGVWRDVVDFVGWLFAAWDGAGPVVSLEDVEAGGSPVGGGGAGVALPGHYRPSSRMRVSQVPEATMP